MSKSYIICTVTRVGSVFSVR